MHSIVNRKISWPVLVFFKTIYFFANFKEIYIIILLLLLLLFYYSRQSMAANEEMRVRGQNISRTESSREEKFAKFKNKLSRITILQI